MIRLYRCDIGPDPMKVKEFNTMSVLKQPYDYSDGSAVNVILDAATVAWVLEEGRLIRARYIGDHTDMQSLKKGKK